MFADDQEASFYSWAKRPDSAVNREGNHGMIKSIYVSVPSCLSSRR